MRQFPADITNCVVSSAHFKYCSIFAHRNKLNITYAVYLLPVFDPPQQTHHNSSQRFGPVIPVQVPAGQGRDSRGRGNRGSSGRVVE